MTTLSMTGAKARTEDRPGRGPALVAAIALSVMAVLAPFAQFGVLASLVVPTDPAATVSNIAGSPGLFGAGIAAFVVVAILDVAVAGGLYVVLRPVDERLARLVAALRVVYALVFASALFDLVGIIRLVDGTSAGSLPSDQLDAQVAASVTAFRTGWDVALAIFGLHLVGLGWLVYRSTDFPRFLGALVALAGAGYLADSLGRVFVPGYALTISTFTFVGEALLIVWLFKVAIKGSRSIGRPRAIEDTSVGAAADEPVGSNRGSPCRAARRS